MHRRLKRLECRVMISFPSMNARFVWRRRRVDEQARSHARAVAGSTLVLCCLFVLTNYNGHSGDLSKNVHSQRCNDEMSRTSFLHLENCSIYV